jgi:hypothetical protein
MLLLRSPLQLLVRLHVVLQRPCSVTDFISLVREKRVTTSRCRMRKQQQHEERVVAE